jgi:cytochrome c oxidase subunit 2
MSRIERRRLMALALLTVLPVPGRAAGPRVIPVVAKKFAFVPDQIHVSVGEEVVLELSAPEVLMGFSAPELGLRQDIVPGRVTRLPFTPQKAGQFVFSCDVFCGSGHEGMDGVIVVAAAG